VFASASLARRIERAEAGLIAEGARAANRRVPEGQVIVRELNGGVAAYVEAGAPFNKVAGVGFDGVPSPETLEQLEREYASRQESPRFEVSTLADPAVVQVLTRRGYGLVGFENVLGLPLDPSSHYEPVAGVEVTRAADDESAAWIDVVATGFMNPDVFDGPASIDSIPRDVLDRVYGDTIAAVGFERYLARREGALAGGASFRMQDGVAQLSGAATLPEHRRKGVQSALLRHRLNLAAGRGCTVAVVTTEPGSKSQENVQKAGFALLYARAVLIREPRS
jgi:GNAT superfamily N-acetyltransferase